MRGVKQCEIVVVIGRHPDGKAATTDLGYTMTVTDTKAGVSKTYTNELGVSSPAIVDLQALDTCSFNE